MRAIILAGIVYIPVSYAGDCVWSPFANPTGTQTICINDNVQTDASGMPENNILVDSVQLSFLYNGSAGISPPGRLVYIEGEDKTLTLTNVELDYQFYNNNNSSTHAQGVVVNSGGTLNMAGGSYDYFLDTSGSASDMPNSAAFRLTSGNLNLDGTNVTISHSTGSTTQTPWGFIMTGTSDVNINNSLLKSSYGGFNIAGGSSLVMSDSEIESQFRAINIASGSDATLNNTDIKNQGSSALFVSGSSSVTLNNSTVENYGGNYYALVAQGGSTVKLNDSSVMSESSGFYIDESEFTLDNSDITFSGSGSSALRNGADLFVLNGSQIISNAGPVLLHNNNTVNISDSEVRNTSSNYTFQTSLTGTGGTSEISVTGPNARAGGVGLLATVAGDSATSDVIVSLRARDNAILDGQILTRSEVSSAAVTGINLDGATWHNGTVQVQDNASVNIDLRNDAVWNGDTLLSSAGVYTPEINISLQDSAWSITGDSTATSLSADNSVVRFNRPSGSTGPLSLTLGELSGTGSTFILNSDIVQEESDRLVITGASSGEHYLTVNNNGSAVTTGDEILTVVETADGGASFELTDSVELGGYLYNVRQNGNDWELFGSSDDDGDGSGPDLTTSADAGANFLNVGYLMNYAETQTLLQRMGDLRQDGLHGDMWMRGYAGKFDSFSGGKLSGFDMTYSGFQIGADKRVSDDTPLFFGVFMGQTTGSPDYRTGNGTTKSSSAGVYGSYMADNGAYVDAVIKYTSLKNQFSVRDSQKQQVTGNGNSDGLTLSLETGHKFSFSESGNGFWIEPQTQFTFAHQNAADINASNGLNIRLGSYESIQGRASALLGYDFSQGDNNVNMYLKTGIVREFDGNVDYKLNGSAEKHTFKGNWWNNGVGISAQINKQHTLYLDVDSSTGNKFNQRQVNGGYRYSF